MATIIDLPTTIPESRALARGFPLRWRDASGTVHGCEGEILHSDYALLNTFCRLDVPPNAAKAAAWEVTCPRCNPRHMH
jgi:hypothetical protein